MARAKKKPGLKVVPMSTYPKSPLDWQLSGRCRGWRFVDEDGGIRWSGCSSIALVYVGFIPKYDRFWGEEHGRFCSHCLELHDRWAPEVQARAHSLGLA